MPRSRRPYDIVHLAQTTFPEDPRPRREAAVAVETGARVVIVVLQGGRDARRVSRYGNAVVIRLPGERRRGSVGKYLVEYLDFLLRARCLLRRHPRLRAARVFHVHSLPDFLVGATRWARRRGAKVILDLHELFPEFTRSRFPGWKGAAGEWIAKGIERWSRRQADVVLTVNHAVASQLRGRPAKTNERIVVVHNYADVGEFGPLRLTDGRTGQSLRLVYHGTLTPLYGLDLAIEAVARAREAGVETQLDIYGDGPAAADLQAQIRALGLEQRTRLLGNVPHDRLRELLPDYDAGFIPTRLDCMTRFSLSTKLLEYVHLGVPVLLPEIPTYQRYLPSDAAWYFAANSAEDAAVAIARFSTASPEERVRRAEHAQQYYLGEIDANAEAAELREIYRDLLRATAGRG